MSAAMTGTDEIAARLTKARADRTAIGWLSAELDGFDLASAYEVQRLLRREAGPLAGWKLGVTSRAKQVQVGVNEPVRGFLAACNGLDLGSPLMVAEHIQPRCEPEIVFIMGADLSGPAVTSSAVLAATASVAVGIEVLDSRYTDYTFTMPDVVADNTSAGRYVVGSAVPAAGLDLRLIGVVLAHNGEVIATGPARPPRPPGGRAPRRPMRSLSPRRCARAPRRSAAGPGPPPGQANPPRTARPRCCPPPRPAS